MLYWRLLKAAGPLALLAAVVGSLAYLAKCLKASAAHRAVKKADAAATAALVGGWRGPAGLKWEEVKPSLSASLDADGRLAEARVAVEVASRSTVRALADKLNLT